MKKKALTFAFCMALFLSICLNLYYLVPPIESKTISVPGYYVSRESNGELYGLSFFENRKVLLYAPDNQVLWEGKLESAKKGNDYLIDTDSDVYQVIVRDDTVFLPVKENGRIVSKLFQKVGDGAVAFGPE